jgi:hypothetical protein
LAIKNGADPDNLERPIAALDLFILEERPEGDIDDVSLQPPLLRVCLGAGLT